MRKSCRSRPCSALLLSVVALLLGACVSVQSDPDTGGAKAQGAQAFQSEDFARAYDLWLPLARAGDAEAQFGVAVIAGNGYGPFADEPTEQRDAVSVQWMRKSASQRFSPATDWMADAYANGWSGLAVDMDRSNCWRAVSKKRTNPEACLAKSAASQ